MKALPRLFRTTAFRFAALYVVLFVASSLVLGAVVLLASRAALQDQIRSRIDAEIFYLQSEQRREGIDHLIGLVRTRGRGASALDYLVQMSDGRHLAGEMPAVARLAPGWTEIVVAETSEDGGRPERDMARVVALDGGAMLAVGSDLAQLGDVEEAVATALAWTVSLAVLLGIGGGAWLSRVFLRRVDAIARTAEAIIAGDMTRRVPDRGTGDDLDRLAASLNRMLDRIAILMGSLQQVSSDVAHDLRTPLTRLYQRLDGARASAVTVGDYEMAIEAASAEAEGLLETFASLLRIAQVEGASPTSGFNVVDLSTLAETVADAYQPDMELQGHFLTTAIEPGISVWGDLELLTQALSNVVENALLHTPAGTRVNVALHTLLGGEPCLSVVDDGPGVSADDQPRLVHRFFRGEHSRTTPGSGLGLSLAHAVSELHKAGFEVGNSSPGLRVALVFPAVPR